jgi:hypothetical protein
MRTALLLAAAIATLGAGRAAAQAPCAEDAERLCPGIPSGDGRLWACLQRNNLQLSSACTRNLQEVRRRASEFNADCANDVFRFCPATPRGGGRVLECLRPHVGRHELSSSCEDAVATAVEKLDEFRTACADDLAALCQGVQPGTGRLLMCLRYQSDKISSRCRQAVSP